MVVIERVFGDLELVIVMLGADQSSLVLLSVLILLYFSSLCIVWQIMCLRLVFVLCIFHFEGLKHCYCVCCTVRAVTRCGVWKLQEHSWFNLWIRSQFSTYILLCDKTRVYFLNIHLKSETHIPQMAWHVGL